MRARGSRRPVTATPTVVDPLVFRQYNVHCTEVGGSKNSRGGRGGKGWWTVLKRETFRIAQVYVPLKRRRTVNAALVRKIAESILELGQQAPILVRPDGDRYVLVEGLHRLEACKALGEETIVGSLVMAHLSSERVVTSSFETDLKAVRQKTERLRQRRLAKEVAEPETASTAKGVEKRSSSDARPEKGRAARQAKTISLQEWLSKREHEGLSY